jgi:hypothetical protein
MPTLVRPVDWILAGDERGPSSRAALLRIVVGKGDAFVADAVDIGRAIAHLSAAVVADIPPADIVALQDENIRFASLSHFQTPSIS